MKKYEAMVLSCMDPRFQPKVFNYLKKKKLTGKYSSFTIAGAAIGVTSKKFNSVIEKKIHNDSFKKIKLILNKRFPKLKLSFKILSLRD